MVSLVILSAFLGDDPSQDQWSEVTHQRNRFQFTPAPLMNDPDQGRTSNAQALSANIYSLLDVNNTTENDASRSPNILGSSISFPAPTPFRFPQHTNACTSAHPHLSATSFPGFSCYFPGRREGTVEEGPGKDIDQPSELRINDPRTRVFFRVRLSLAWLLVNPSDGELARRLFQSHQTGHRTFKLAERLKRTLKVKESLSYHWKNGCTHFKKNSTKLDQNLLSMWASLILKTLIKEKPQWQTSSKDCRILCRPGSYVEFTTDPSHLPCDPKSFSLQGV